MASSMLKVEADVVDFPPVAQARARPSLADPVVADLVAALAPLRPRGVPSLMRSSTKVFHSPQSVHRPSQRER